MLGGAVAGLSGPLLAACGPGRSPGQQPVSLRSEVPQCVSLAGHTFTRGGRYCDRGPGGDRESMITPLDHQGPLIATADTLTSYYIDAIVEWEIATGEPIRLLAPQRADNWVYARCGESTVNPRCDGVLVVHRDGCAVAELVGHIPGGHRTPGSPTDGIQGLCRVADDHLISLGTDNTLRRWRLDAADQVAETGIASSAEDRTLGPGPDAGTVLVAHSTGAELFDAETLRSRAAYDGLPASAVGWVSSPAGLLAGVSAGDERGLLIWDPATGRHELLATNDAPGAVAVSATGVVAAVNGLVVWLRTPDGRTSRVRLADPSYLTGAAAFSPDERMLHILDKRTGIRTVELATGRTITAYRELAP